MHFYIAFGLTLLLAVTYADHHEHEHAHAHHGNHAAAETHSGHEHYSVKTHDDLIKARATCIAKVEAPVELVEKFKKWDFPDENKSHCYVQCILQEFGLFDDQHGFHVHEIHQQLEGKNDVDHSNQLHEQIDKCADNNQQGSDVCAWAYRGAMCFFGLNLSLVKQSVSS